MGRGAAGGAGVPAGGAVERRARLGELPAPGRPRGDWQPARAAQFLGELLGGQIGWRRLWCSCCSSRASAGGRAAPGATATRPGRCWRALTLPRCGAVRAARVGRPGAGQLAGDPVSRRGHRRCRAGRTALAAAALARGGARAGDHLLVYVQAASFALALPARIDPIAHQLAGWDGLAASVEAARRAQGAGFVAVEDYAVSAELARALPAGVTVLGVEQRWRLFRLPAAETGDATGLLVRRAGSGEPVGWREARPVGETLRSSHGVIVQRLALWRVAGPDPSLPAVVLPRYAPATPHSYALSAGREPPRSHCHCEEPAVPGLDSATATPLAMTGWQSLHHACCRSPRAQNSLASAACCADSARALSWRAFPPCRRDGPQQVAGADFGPPAQQTSGHRSGGRQKRARIPPRLQRESVRHGQAAPLVAPQRVAIGRRSNRLAAGAYPHRRRRGQAVGRLLGPLGARRRRLPAKTMRSLGREKQGRREGRLHNLGRLQAAAHGRGGSAVRPGPRRHAVRPESVRRAYLRRQARAG